MRQLICSAMLGTIVAFGGPARAELPLDQLGASELCAPIYSVHKKGCEIERVFLCDYDQQKTLLYETYEEMEPPAFDLTTFDGDVISSVGVEVSILEVFENRDPFSLTTLIETGSETSDQTFLSTIPIFVDPTPVDVKSDLKLFDEFVELGGVVFSMGTADYQFRLNALTASAQMDIYVDPISKAVISGGLEISIAGDGIVEDLTPVDLFLPDNPAFEITQPQYQCEAIS